MPTKDLLYLEEVVELARAGSLSTVRHWLRTGKLASVRPGRRRLVRRSDLEEFLRRGARPASWDATMVDPRQAVLQLPADEPAPAGTTATVPAPQTPSPPTIVRRSQE
jgi:excisionase family DNA binding protein